MPVNDGNKIYHISDYQKQAAPAPSAGDLKSGGGGDRFDPMEARVAKLEAAVEHIQRDTTDIKADLRGLRDLVWSNFKLTFAALIAVAIGLAGLMAKGFHWI
jgi:hypothetical protein